MVTQLLILTFLTVAFIDHLDYLLIPNTALFSFTALHGTQNHFDYCFTASHGTPAIRLPDTYATLIPVAYQAVFSINMSKNCFCFVIQIYNDFPNNHILYIYI